MYVSFVLIAERMARTFWFNKEKEVVFYEDVTSDPILDLLFQLYLVRGRKLYYLENHIMSKLLLLYQSPDYKRKYLTRIFQKYENKDDYETNAERKFEKVD